MKLPKKVTSSTPEGVTYGVDQKYKAPPDTSRYANIKTAAGCVALLVLIGSVPFIVTRAGKRKEKDGNSEKEYVETSHKEAVHRIVDTNQRYRAYIEQSNDKGYNLVVVGTNGYWTEISQMRNMHIVLLTKTALNWIKFNSSKQNFNFSKVYSPRTRGSSHKLLHDLAAAKIFPANAGVFRLQTLIWQFHSIFPANAGSTYGGVSGCRYANISLHMQGSTRICAASFDHRNIPRERGVIPV